jgi:hypothetical protein
MCSSVQGAAASAQLRQLSNIHSNAPRFIGVRAVVRSAPVKMLVLPLVVLPLVVLPLVVLPLVVLPLVVLPLVVLPLVVLLPVPTMASGLRNHPQQRAGC